MERTHRPWSMMRFGLIASVVIAASLALSSVASAATINVTTTVDEFNAGSRCSLREAVWAANNDSIASAPGCAAGSGNDTIKVPAGQFNLDRGGASEDLNVSGDLDVTDLVTITHTGLRPAIISSRINNERVFETTAAGGVTLSGLTIEGGESNVGPEDHGGGILNSGVLTVLNSTIHSNQAVYGGAVSTQGLSTTNLINVTISGNGAYEDGGGVSVETDGKLTMKSVTVTANEADIDGSGGGDGGGLFTSTSGGPTSLSLKDTIVSGNRDNGNEALDCAKLGGDIVSQGHNLIGNANGCDYTAGPGDIVNQRALLLPGLRDNGGPTLTHAFKNRESPAIDKGKGCPATDQRGVPRNLGGRCDIGAVESAMCQGVVINRVGTSGPDLLEGTSHADGILGQGGGDVLKGFGGKDGLCGGSGKDRLEGGPSNDKLDGGAGRDTCIGGPGKNKLVKCERKQ